MLTLDLICNIIKTQLDLTDKQIWIYNQRVNPELATDKGLFVVVGNLAVKPFGVNRKYTSDTGLSESITVQMQENIYVEIWSQDISAMLRLPEVLAAMNSNYAEQLQEKYGFHIGTVPVTINDISSLEGTSILYKFNITYNVIRSYEVNDRVDYYNSFANEIITEKGEI